MKARFLFLIPMIAVLGACDRIPGKPEPEERWKPPSANLDFDDLYAQNCAGCHGLEPGDLAASRPMDPLYVRFAGRENLRRITAEGVPGTTMPGFLESEGGALTEAQVGAIVDGIVNRFGDFPVPDPLPPYAAGAGDASAGLITQGVFCASCHGADGAGGPKAGSIVDPAYLSLVTDQSLRSTIVAGRPELGMPDFTGYVPDRLPTEKEIADIVAWLSSKRPANAQVSANTTSSQPIE